MCLTVKINEIMQGQMKIEAWWVDVIIKGENIHIHNPCVLASGYGALSMLMLNGTTYFIVSMAMINETS